MSILDIEYVVKLCKDHIDLTKSNGSEIEDYLTKFLLVYVCGEYEKEIKQMINQRVIKTGDRELSSFVSNKIDVRSLYLRDIRGNILKHFSADVRDSFNAIISGTESELRYHNIIENRNLAAHGEPINMTFPEFIQSYKLAGDILKAISIVLQ